MHPADPRVALLRDHLVGYVLKGTDGIRFHLGPLIGEGGQGWIYKGNYDEADGLPIVIKVLRPDGLSDETLRRFQREAAVLRQLGAQANPNPNLVRFYDHGIVELSPPNSPPHDKVALPFTVLEYVHGATLANVIEDQRGAGLPTGRARRLLRQVAFALSSVHAQGIIHRDLKPSNILVMIDQGTEVVKVTDFGLAKLVDFNAHKTTTLAGASLGYAPPEQYERGNERVTARTDVFSFATILFECLTGTPAFAYKSGENPIRLIQQMMTGPRPSLTRDPRALSLELRDNAQLISELDSRLAQATQADPDHRQASVREFWDSIDPLLRAASEASVNPPPPVQFLTPQRPRESVNPAHAPAGARYAFRAVGTLPRKDVLRNVSIAPNGVAFALGGLGLYRWSQASWSMVSLPGWLDPGILHGVLQLSESTQLVFGGRGTVVTSTASGEAQPWRLPDDDFELHGALVERAGVVLVGCRRSTPKGVCLEAASGRPPSVRTIESTGRLNAVARLTSGALVACGNDGALARIDTSMTAAIPWSRTGHLLGIAARADGGAFAVGSGGHAVSMSPNLQAVIEPVQTTRDLISVAVAKDGSAWASATHGRILQRRGTTWTRVSLGSDADESIPVLAVQPLIDSSVLVVTASGQVLEGRADP